MPGCVQRLQHGTTSAPSAGVPVDLPVTSRNQADSRRGGLRNRSEPSHDLDVSDQVTSRRDKRHRLAAWVHLANDRLTALEEADRRMTAAGLATRHRVNLYRQERHDEWEEAAVTRPGILTHGHLWDVQNATYLLVVVLAQIEKVRPLLPTDGIPGYPDSRDLRLWRNVLEHWEDDMGPSLAELLRSEPGLDTSTLHYSGPETSIGHLSTDQVRVWLGEVSTATEEASVRDEQLVPRPHAPVYADEPRLDSD